MNLTDAYYLRHYPVIHHQDGFKLVREISITEFSALCIIASKLGYHYTGAGIFRRMK